jgi:hypothetical protein
VFPDGGVRLAELIPAALVTIEGMGHQSQDPARWQAITDAVTAHAYAVGWLLLPVPYLI